MFTVWIWITNSILLSTFKLLRLKISPTCTKTQIILIYILISIKYQSFKTSKLLKGVPNPLKIDLDKPLTTPAFIGIISILRLISSPETHRCLNHSRYTLILWFPLFPTPKWRLPHHNGYYQQQKTHLMDISLCFCRALNFRINRNGQWEKFDLKLEQLPNTIDEWSLIQSKCC